jgi:hypothetical protein
MKRKQKQDKDTGCTHPPHRLYAWFAGKVECVCCCDCGKVLTGGATLTDEKGD